MMREKKGQPEAEMAVPRRAAPVVGRFFRLFWASILACVAALIYLNALPNPFLIDDQLVIVQHPDVIEAQGLKRLWFHDYWAGATEDHNLYRPLSILSYHLNARWVGLEPVGFRAVNVAILAMVGVIAAAWASRFMRREAAWLAAFFFVCHPANTESINHIVGRADLQALLGVVTFLYVQRHMIERGRWSALGVATAALSALLAVGSKESGLVVVPAAAMQAWVCGWLSRDGAGALGTPGIRSDDDPPQSTSGLLKLHHNEDDSGLDPEDLEEQAAPASRPRRSWRDSAMLADGYAWGVGLALLAAGLFLAARAAVVGFQVGYTQTLDDLTSNPLRAMGFFERLPGVLQAAWIYSRQLFLPDTSFVLTPDTLAGWGGWRVWAGAGVLAFLSLTWFTLTWIRHWLAVVLTLALAHWLLIGHLLFPIGVFAANRLTPPFTLAASLMLGAFVHRLIQHAIINSPRALSYVPRGGAMTRFVGRNPWAAPAVFSLVLVVMSMVVVQANMQWRSELVRAESDRGVETGHPICLYYFGTALANMATGRNAPTILAKAEAALAEAVERRPDSAQARVQWAGVLWRLHQREQAAREYRRALEIMPNHFPAASRLGVLLLTTGDYEGAMTQLTLADQLKPGDPDTLFNLAEAAKAAGRYTDAVKRYQTLLAAFPRHEKGLAQYKELLQYLAQEAGPMP